MPYRIGNSGFSLGASYFYANLLNGCAETDGDALYCCSRKTSLPYRGLFHYRYGVRTDDHSSALNFPAGLPGPFFGSLPYFVYNRAQPEYDF